MSTASIRVKGRGLVVALSVAVVVASCGGSSGGPTWNGVGMDGGSGSGGGGDDGSQPGVGILNPDGSRGPGIGFIDSGGSGSSGSGGTSDASPVPLGCGLYTKLCGGKCIPIAVDPQNCGDCGKVCAPTEICSASACVPASKGCVPPPQGGDPALTVCGQSCVDTLNDSNNCGMPTGTSACGHKCPASQGCVNGVCVPQLPVGATPPAAGCGECLNDLARATFRWALCSCGDVTLSQQLFTDAYDSTKGPYPPTPLQVGGGVGVNGNFTGGGAQISIGGALWCSGATGVNTNSPATVSQETHVAQALNGTGGSLRILDSAWVGGSVGGTVNIGKTLYVPTTATVGAGVTSAAMVRQPVTVAPPCDCSDTALLGQSISQIVAAHATSNDNAAIGLNAGALATPTMSTRLDLPCGRYYLTGINQPGTSVTIFAHGRTSLFIQGDVVGATVSFVLDPTATFDTFITGTVRASGQLIVGSPNYPALSRTYVGGAAPVDLSGEAGRTAGNLYMGKTPLNVSSHFVLYGGLIAASLANQENIEIHYDRAVLEIPKCGAPPPMCNGCKDCGNDPCINGMCSPTCTSSTQCCAPLVCAGGKCQVIGTAL